ncbi:hypothetical protein OB905_01560 [Halobacteria archaeon AArc-dxtr1]|nr:hypothetical protein [Halobacteria archaeon AArc-dxtr1]
MADDHTNQPSDEDADRSEPGGGPKRVVSDTSVDDILNSITRQDDEQEAGPNETDDEPPASQPDASVAEHSSEPTVGEDDEAPEAEKPADETAEDERSTAEKPADETAEDKKSTAEKPADERPDPDELADRIERGAVTGADVRQAEAGEGREPTPDVDEIDLSLDDIDASSPTRATIEGPADGSDEGDERNTTESSDDAHSSGGLVAKLKRFFTP